MEGLGTKLVYIHNSNERIFKEILLDGSDVRKDLPQNNAGQIAFPSSARIMVAGVDDREKSSGSIKCYRFPLSQHFE
jgi:hypothetical protein